MPPEAKLNPPFRAEHVGSLLRPRELKDAFGSHARGELDDAAYRAVLERCAREAIRLQEDSGMQSITDGEFRRVAWSTGLLRALGGLEDRESLFEFHGADGKTQKWNTCIAVARLSRARPVALEEFRFVRANTRRTPKVTIPSPSFLHFFRLNECADRAVYPDLAEFWSDVVEIYRAELADLAQAGATFVQLDEVPQAMLCDENVRDRVREHGEDPARLTRQYVEVVNRVLERRPEGMTIGMHLCRGNLRGRWMAAGGYEAIAEPLFNDLKVDGFLLEYDTPRAGDFSPLRMMPGDKFVRLGIVSSKTAALEDKNALKRRIDEAARFVALDRLGISPQCGFASTAGGNPLSIDDERRKLELVAEVAREVWD